MWKFINGLAVCFIALLMLAGCDDGSSTRTQPQPTRVPAQPTSRPRPTATSLPAGTADLSLSGVSIVREDPQQGSPYYQFEGVVRNSGNADTSGFEAGCTYTCPGGLTISGGFSLVQGGYIGSNSSFTYRSTNRISCDPVPAILTDVTCDVDSNNDVQESSENNNTHNPGQLSVPF